MKKGIAFLKKKQHKSAKDLFLIAGLGNPGKNFASNRHNIGFLIADKIADMLGEKFSRVQSRALISKGRHQGSKVVLAKPTTFMNLSGQAIGPLVKFYKVPVSHILIIYDELDLPFDSIRLKPSGGSAGHKGMKSIIDHLGTQEFARLRVGIGRPPVKRTAPSHVLQDFSRSQLKDLPFVVSAAAESALYFVEHGINEAMNKYNKRGE